MSNDPSPDAPLIEAMAEAALQVWVPDAPRGYLDCDRADCQNMLRAALTAARAQGYALVPVGLLEEAADAVDEEAHNLDVTTYEDDTESKRMVARLRDQAARLRRHAAAAGEAL